MEVISKAGVQAIGMAFNVNPCFFAIHLLPKDKSCQCTDELYELGKRFESHVQSQSEVKTQVANGMHHWIMGGSDWSSAVGYRTLEKGIPGSRDRQVSWSPADDARPPGRIHHSRDLAAQHATSGRTLELLQTRSYFRSELGSLRVQTLASPPRYAGFGSSKAREQGIQACVTGKVDGSAYWYG